MKRWNRALAAVLSAVMLCGAAAPVSAAQTTPNEEASYTWDAMRIGGGGFVSGIVTGKAAMYARTDVGGAYRFNYNTDEWEQLFGFLTEAERGYLSVDAMAVDPTDDDTVYFLCGCAYFSDQGTRIYKTTDGGRTFTYTDVTDLIQVHGNGYGRQCGESIAIDPDNPDVIYCGGDVAHSSSGLIKSTDGGRTWASVDSFADTGLFNYTVRWPDWDGVTYTVKAATHNRDGNNAYTSQNGVACITIVGGKVYVGVSKTDMEDGGANVVVADTKTDIFTALSADLPTNWYPSHLTQDANGDIFISYLADINLDKVGGGAYRYHPADGTVTDISPCESGIGEIYADPDDPDRLVTATCANAPTSQLWEPDAWDKGTVQWGERIFRSEDGGTAWHEITPGNEQYWSGPLMADYLQDGGYEWIRNKSIHWASSIVLDPTNPDRYYITSGNGVFRCDGVWDDLPVVTFHPTGIEEVVALDMVSIPGGAVYSAIGDYDGFIHTDENTVPEQYQPNLGSCSSIAYCPQNPDVMVRVAEHNNETGSGFYSLDAGKTWTKMSIAEGGKAFITQLDKDTYRIFVTAAPGNKKTDVSYSDDFGVTWNECTGLPSAHGSKPTFLLVEPEHPETVYAYVCLYNESWVHSKTAPDASDSQYILCVSSDYGKSFTKAADIAMYDQCDGANRIGYLGEGRLALAAGWYGMYTADVSGTSAEITKLDVFYCKTLGYGAPEKAGGVNTLFMYGRPQESDPEGIYRSTDAGKTWVCINTEHIYGGTGNGNFLVGDMNTFGEVYMSTVGCGIIYGKPGAQPETQPTTAAGTVNYGDVNCDGKVNIMDVIMLNKNLLGGCTLTAQGKLNADVDVSNKIDSADSLSIMKFIVGILSSFPVK